ncbi:MAG: DNA gyrase/topoisomerase IV subunit A, partial [Bacteroidia bacterium]|nr:DNA gyrase/topoisomerase IV subunit A [Bacteroidia bacterium]
RGKDRKPNLEVNLEEFIAVKGINALGNQLTKEKVNQINLLDPLPYEAPEEIHADEMEVVDEEIVVNNVEDIVEDNKLKENETSTLEDDSKEKESDGDGQITLF